MFRVGLVVSQVNSGSSVQFPVLCSEWLENTAALQNVGDT